MRCYRLMILAPAALILLAQAPDLPAPSPDIEHVPAKQAESILGARVNDADGKTAGRLIDVLVDQAGQPQAAVIDVGGFMGVGTRRIAVHWSALRFALGGSGAKVILDMSVDQIRAAPEYRDTSRSVPVVTPGQAAPAAEPSPPPP